MKKDIVITTQKQADKAKWKLFDLENKIEELRTPLKAFNEEKDLKEKIEKYENRTFFNPKGGGIVYVQEAHKYGLRCIILQGGYSPLERERHSSYGHHSYGASFVINVDFSYDEMYDSSEWIGVGKSEYEDLVKRVKMMEEFFITKNKSI